MLFGRHIVELNVPNNTLVRSYVLGLDLSGMMDGAYGVGGLLWVTLHTGSGPAAGTHFVAYDGNGNIVALSAASDGLETARYEYGPFGEPIRVSGPAAALNPFRFSTKRTCNTTELVLYEYRAYNPVLGRWLSRDPIEESGGLNLYMFVANMPVFRLDRDGRFWAHLHAVATALAGSGAGLSGSCVLLLIAGNISTDVLPGIMNDHAYHYTRPIYGNKAVALAKGKAVMEGLIRRGCELARRGACKSGLWLIGMGLHVQQDYWSHVVGGEPVSYDPEAEKGRIAYPADDDPNHRDHARDFDWGLAFEAAKESFIVLLWAKNWCLGCCCN
jgi:RHS repeat-associated protein